MKRYPVRSAQMVAPSSKLPTKINVMDFLLYDSGSARLSGAGYRSASGLLEDWWRARPDDGFVPVYER